MQLKSKSASDTKEIGRILGSLARPGMVFTMKGNLGSGKTTMAQGIAKGLGITKTVSSPTFTILKVYHGRLDLFHIDAYRLENLHQDIGLEECILSDGLCIIEWSEFIQELVGDSYLAITIETDDDEINRTITFEAKGHQYEQLLEEFKHVDTMYGY